MEFTQQQARELVGIEEGTFVYWAKLMPRVARLKGKGRRFKLADVLALAVLATAVQEIGCMVGHIAPTIDDIFDLFHSMTFDEAGNKILILTPGKCDVRIHMPSLDHDVGNGFVLVRLAPLTERIKARLDAKNQFPLPF